MKALTIMTYVGAAGVAVFSVTMAKTNPSQTDYEEYAVQRLTQYLKQDVCKKTSRFIENLLNSKCDKLVDSANPEIKDILAATTQRQDFIVFSVYRTDLELSSWLPSYRFETVGAFNNFYTYTAEQQ
ncbi:hypothetical protein A6770_34055 [Nostoc minutum NIES-26]|uniref:DUF4359 domain-containing protein n=1 Tax=Nostoc minutum NIES-26 TaxID=1844469 RepID=A0A367Q242_9NOSO|nr:DUF4359 domain-containing protein [Dendronalium sp. ChiSLP03b]MDZ8203959.1 DUF4359 domain-containing protein [Dendronalium sp. ChiSLP03b]RCJ17384.1 hypothetical protein A6770_34055 [Nostoc minutum NIES-26]